MKRLCIILAVILLAFVACKKRSEAALLSEAGDIAPSQTNESPTPPTTNEAPNPSITNEQPTPPVTNDHRPTPPIGTNFPPAFVVPMPDDDIPSWSPSTIYRDKLDIDPNGTPHQFKGLIFRASDSTGTIIKEAWIEVRMNGNIATTHLCYASGYEYELTQRSDLVKGHFIAERAGQRFWIDITENAELRVCYEKYHGVYEVYKCVMWTK